MTATSVCRFRDDARSRSWPHVNCWHARPNNSPSLIIHLLSRIIRYFSNIMLGMLVLFVLFYSLRSSASHCLRDAAIADVSL
jgi:hypothetical protein